MTGTCALVFWKPEVKHSCQNFWTSRKVAGKGRETVGLVEKAFRKVSIKDGMSAVEPGRSLSSIFGSEEMWRADMWVCDMLMSTSHPSL